MLSLCCEIRCNMFVYLGFGGLSLLDLRLILVCVGLVF